MALLRLRVPEKGVVIVAMLDIDMLVSCVCVLFVAHWQSQLHCSEKYIESRVDLGEPHIRPACTYGAQCRSLSHRWLALPVKAHYYWATGPSGRRGKAMSALNGDESVCPLAQGMDPCAHP